MATVTVLLAAAVPGLYLVWRGGPVLAMLGLLAIVAAVTYTAGPKPFGYLGLGELFVFIFFGPVAVVGTAFVMTHDVTRLALLSSVAMGCLVTAILVVNNLRDIDTDRVAGKRTLAVRIGTGSHSLGIHGADRWWPTRCRSSCGGRDYPSRGHCSRGRLLHWRSTLCDRSGKSNGRGLNPVLGGTARLCLWFAVTLGAGIAL